MERTIAIVGGGYCGTLLAALLLRGWRAAPLRIVLIESAPWLGRGVAYQRRAHPFLLNVPAGRMSAEVDDALSFLRYARRRWPECTDEDFVPRECYGDYMEDVLQKARRDAPAGVRLDVLHLRAVDIQHRAPGQPVVLVLQDGTRLSAGHVVLATGNPPPSRLPCTRGLTASDGYVHDPWAADLEFTAGERLLLIGTSLTMVDVLSAAAAAPGRPAMVHALSRRGMVPPPQTPFRPGALDGSEAAALLDAAVSMRRLTRAVRTLAVAAERKGGDWREVVTQVRALAPEIWRRLPDAERRRFLRHVRTIWDVHRHRLPPGSAERVAACRVAGWLEVHAAQIMDIAMSERGLAVRWRVRGTGAERTVTVDRIINCTGPDYDPARSQDPLLAGLLRAGLARRDALGLGLSTGPLGALIDAAGRQSAQLYCLGPMLRADHWEATAALELRDHALRLAAHLGDSSRLQLVPTASGGREVACEAQR